MQQIKTLETQQVLLFRDAMHHGTCRHCKNGCVEQTEKYIASIDDSYHQHWLDNHIKLVDFPFNQLQHSAVQVIENLINKVQIFNIYSAFNTIIITQSMFQGVNIF